MQNRDFYLIRWKFWSWRENFDLTEKRSNARFIQQREQLAADESAVLHARGLGLVKLTQAVFLHPPLRKPADARKTVHPSILAAAVLDKCTANTPPLARIFHRTN